MLLKGVLDVEQLSGVKGALASFKKFDTCDTIHCEMKRISIKSNFVK